MPKQSMKIYTPDRSDLMEITALEQRGDDLIIKGKIMGSMPMTAVLRPEEARKALGLLNVRLILFLISLLFRRGAASRTPARP